MSETRVQRVNLARLILEGMLVRGEGDPERIERALFWLRFVLRRAGVAL